MRSFFPICLFISILLVFSSFVTCSSRDTKSLKEEGYIQIIRGSKTSARIVIPPVSDSIVLFAASELQKYIGKVSGASLPIACEADNPGESLVIRFELRPELKVKYDGYRIEVSPSGIDLLARESRGLLYAVYDLLKEIGCAFVYPGEEEEIVPRLNEINIPLGSRSEQPSIEHRGLAFYGLDGTSIELGRKIIDWMAKNRFNIVLVSEDRPSDCPGNAHACIWREVSEELLPELQKRGFLIDMSEHSTHVFFPRSLFKEHPEWFALNDGKRTPGQICYSNSEAVEYYAQAQVEYAEIHPEIHFLGTWPLDGGGYCECENCKSIETVFKAAARVAESVHSVRPDLAVEHLAYRQQTWEIPQTVPVPENVSVLFCPSDKINLARSWVEATKEARGTYLFEYKMGDNYHFTTNVWLRPEFAKNVARHAVEIGYRGVISLYLPIQNWWRLSFNNYFFAAACWDNDLNIEQELENYYRNYYGEQAQDVGEIFQIVMGEMQNDYLHVAHNALMGRNGAVIAPEGVEMTLKATDRIISLLERISLEATSPAVRLRLDRLAMYVKYFAVYYEAYDNRNPANLDNLMEFSRLHQKNHSAVIIYPDYIENRMKEYYR